MLKNKIRTIVIITLILLILSAQVISAKTLSLSGITITVDAGHGGRDPGTTYGKIYEKDINLEIAKKLQNDLATSGATVYMTRTADVDLSSIYDSKKKRGDLYRRLLIKKTIVTYTFQFMSTGMIIHHIKEQKYYIIQ